MSRDIDRVIERVKERLPMVQADQLAPSHPQSDEDGLWFFRMPDTNKEIAIESATGDCPFIIEHDDMRNSTEAETAGSVDEAVDKLWNYLTGGTAVQ